MQLDVKKEFENGTPFDGSALSNPENPEQRLDELAILSPVEYDQQRKAAAKELGIRLSTLEDEIKKRRPKDETDSKGGRKLELSSPEPWPERVDGGELLNDLTGRF